MIALVLTFAAALANAAPAAATIDVQPKLLVLGEEPSRAVLRIASQARPRVAASVGRIENLRREGPSLWVADFVPPEETIPRVAIVSAVEGEALGWTAIPLWGQGDAVVQTRPHARISVEIGPRSFGPVQADATGQAMVPVIVPPGVHEARQRGRVIDLHVPRMPLLQVVLLAERGRADRAEDLAVRLLAVDEAGKPLEGAQLEITPSRGSVTGLAQHAPGELWATWSIPAGAAGTERLVVELADAKRLTAEASVPLEPGLAATIQLTSDRAQLIAGEPAPLRVHAVARDGAGNLSLEPLVVDGLEPADGEWQLRAPERIDGVLTLVAHPRGRAQPRATLALPLLPAEPAKVMLDPPAASVQIGSRLQLHAKRTDRFGNLVRSAAPTASAGQGSFAAVAAQPDGAWLATWVPPRAWTGEPALVEVRFGPDAARSSISIVPRDGLLALSPKLGAITNFRRLAAPLVGLEAALRTDRFGPELGLSLEAAWSYEGRSDVVRQFQTTTRDNFYSLSSQISLRRRVGVRTVLFAGAGPSLTLLTSRLYVGSAPAFSETGVVPGALLSAGAELRFVRAVPFGELRWSWHADPSFSSLRGSVSALSILLGTRFELL